MEINQLKDSSFLFLGNTLIKISNFVKQILLAYFLGVSGKIDIYLMALIIPTIIQGMIGGGAGELIVTKLKTDVSNRFLEIYVSALFFILILVIGIYLVSIKYWIMLFDLDPENLKMFYTLCYIFILNLIPSFFSSILQPLLYFRGYFKFYVYRTILSEFIAIAFILFTAKSLGIYSFAIALTLSFIVQASLYLFKSDLKFSALTSLRTWITNRNDLIISLKQTFLLGLQTLIYHLSTFWERSLSIKYLAPGYLSSYNYSKTLSEMPKSIFLSSILTTTYIEQSKKSKLDQNDFYSYSKKMSSLLLKVSCYAQILLIVFSPFILILFYKRGQFDNDAVKSTMLIFQILTIGFIPSLLFPFFSRSMYIIAKYKSLLFAIITKSFLQIGILLLFIKEISNILPYALVVSNYFITFILANLLHRHNEQFIDIKKFNSVIIILLVFSISLIYLYSFFINSIIELTTLHLIALYAFPLLITILFIYKYVRKNELLNQIYLRLLRKIMCSI